MCNTCTVKAACELGKPLGPELPWQERASHEPIETFWCVGVDQKVAPNSVWRHAHTSAIVVPP